MNARTNAGPRIVRACAAPALLGWQAAAFAQGQGQLPLLVGSGSGGMSFSVPIQTLIFFTALSFLPAILLLMTGFTRIVIVLRSEERRVGKECRL